MCLEAQEGVGMLSRMSKVEFNKKLRSTFIKLSPMLETVVISFRYDADNDQEVWESEIMGTPGSPNL